MSHKPRGGGGFFFGGGRRGVGRSEHHTTTKRGEGDRKRESKRYLLATVAMAMAEPSEGSDNLVDDELPL